LARDSRCKVAAIVWAGGPQTALNRFRSIGIGTLKPLLALPRTTWFSLQKGEHERDSEAFANAFEMHTLGPIIEDFTDTLAILETLDLVITVDTAVAHLAVLWGQRRTATRSSVIEWFGNSFGRASR
jgi:hypothetical protein